MYGANPSMSMDANVSVANFEMDSGILSSNHNLTITDTGYWTGGTMFGSGKTIIDTNADLEIYTSLAPGVTLNKRTLVNRGTINWDGTVGSITLMNNALIDNQIGAFFNTGGGVQTVAVVGTGGTFRNAGTLYIGGAPWGSTGILNIAGTFKQTLDGKLIVDINGPILGTNYSQLALGGAGILNGTVTFNYNWPPPVPWPGFMVVVGSPGRMLSSTPGAPPLSIDDSSLTATFGMIPPPWVFTQGVAGSLVE
jgi:hypothetical protein